MRLLQHHRVGMRLPRLRRVDTRRHRRVTSHLQPVTSRRHRGTSSLQVVIRRHPQVGIRPRLHVQLVLLHLRVDILCRRVAWPILLWI